MEGRGAAKNTRRTRICQSRIGIHSSENERDELRTERDELREEVARLKAICSAAQ